MEFNKKDVKVEVMIKLGWEEDKNEQKGFWCFDVEVGFIDGIPTLGGIKDIKYSGQLRLIDALIIDGVINYLKVLNEDAINRMVKE